jgi:hypothetical protein
MPLVGAQRTVGFFTSPRFTSPRHAGRGTPREARRVRRRIGNCQPGIRLTRLAI